MTRVTIAYIRSPQSDQTRQSQDPDSFACASVTATMRPSACLPSFLAILHPANLCLQLGQPKLENDTKLLPVKLQPRETTSRTERLGHLGCIRMHGAQISEHALASDQQSQHRRRPSGMFTYLVLNLSSEGCSRSHGSQQFPS